MDKRIVSLLYGHHGSGKLYDYIDPTGTKRTGDLVTPEVTHAKSERDYLTLGRVMKTRRFDGEADLKILGATDQRALAGYYTDWGKDATAANQLKGEILAGVENERERDTLLALVRDLRQQDIDKAKRAKLLAQVMKIRRDNG